MSNFNQRGISLGAVILVLICLSAILATIQSVWGPHYEERCTQPTPEEVQAAERLNSVMSSPLGVKAKAEPKCEKVRVN